MTVLGINKIIFVNVADGLAYSALLKNELLGAGIEKIQDPQTEDRRLQPSTPEKRSLFSVRLFSYFSCGELYSTFVIYCKNRHIIGQKLNLCIVLHALHYFSDTF